jgi:hypothetical protein
MLSKDTVAAAKIDEALKLWEDMWEASTSHITHLVEKTRKSRKRTRELADKLQRCIDEECSNGTQNEGSYW